MRVVFGLGNPGAQFQDSRHNLGFRVLDRVAGMLGAAHWKRQREALISRGVHEGQAFCLVKPQTYMNNSGTAVAEVLRFFKVQPADWLVVVDDLDLPVGRIRQRVSGSAGGHHGLESVSEWVGGQAFKRMRIGIGRPAQGQSVVQHVLSSSLADEEALERAIEKAAAQVVRFIATGEFENWSSS